MKTLINFIIILFFIAIKVSAQEKPKISFQGTLKDATGSAVADGTYQVEFRLYNVEEGGTILWSETAQVESSGGVYSHYLGSEEDLDAEVFGEQLYLGVKIGASELQPRTELTYAPYTFASNTALLGDSVLCSGAVGDVKYSRLNPTQFATVNGDCWVPMDGTTIAGTKLANILQTNTIPDASGMFIRTQEFIDGNDPDRTPMSPIATVQAESFLNHTHTFTFSPSGHTHTGYDTYNNNQTSGLLDADGSGAFRTVYNNANTSSVPDHNHTVSIANTGGTETRPKNINLYIYIRVN